MYIYIYLYIYQLDGYVLAQAKQLGGNDFRYWPLQNKTVTASDLTLELLIQSRHHCCLLWPILMYQIRNHLCNTILGHLSSVFIDDLGGECENKHTVSVCT